MPVPVMPSSLAGIARFPRARLGHAPTPLDPAPNLGGALGIDLWIKRDDCTGLAFGGNKVRQIEFHFGEAEARGADTVLVTGAVQSNLVRIAAASARRLGMEACILAPIGNVPVRFSGPRTPPPHRLRRDLAVRVPEPHVGTGTRRRKRVERNRAMRNRAGRRRQSPKAGRTGGGIVAEGQPGGGGGRGDPGTLPAARLQTTHHQHPDALDRGLQARTLATTAGSQACQ